MGLRPKPGGRAVRGTMQLGPRPTRHWECSPVQRSRIRLLIVGLLLGVLSVPAAAGAQPAGRRAATLESLSLFPALLPRHGGRRGGRGGSRRRARLPSWMTTAPGCWRSTSRRPRRAYASGFEATGTFYDVGRLEPDDSRLANLPLDRLTTALLGKSWPGVGELPVLVASSTRVVAGEAGPGGATLRALALDPAAYLDAAVTISGRFRGRNLYGDLPAAPGRSRWDFVLASVDAAVWVVGQEPKGDGFELDVQARIDTGRWLEVTGRVALHDGDGPARRVRHRAGRPAREPPADRAGPAAAGSGARGDLQRAAAGRRGRAAGQHRAHPVLARHGAGLVRRPGGRGVRRPGRARRRRGSGRRGRHRLRGGVPAAQPCAGDSASTSSWSSSARSTCGCSTGSPRPTAPRCRRGRCRSSSAAKVHSPDPAPAAPRRLRASVPWAWSPPSAPADSIGAPMRTLTVTGRTRGLPLRIAARVP